jgi:hypothetical protein
VATMRPKFGSGAPPHLDRWIRRRSTYFNSISNDGGTPSALGDVRSGGFALRSCSGCTARKGANVRAFACHATTHNPRTRTWEHRRSTGSRCTEPSPAAPPLIPLRLAPELSARQPRRPKPNPTGLARISHSTCVLRHPIHPLTHRSRLHARGFISICRFGDWSGRGWYGGPRRGPPAGNSARSPSRFGAHPARSFPNVLDISAVSCRRDRPSTPVPCLWH